MTTDVAGRVVTWPRAERELVVRDLCAALPEVVDRLADRLDAGEALDAYLLAAGAVQIAEDFLHRDVLGTRRAASYLTHEGDGLVVRAGARLLLTVAAAGDGLRRLAPGDHRVARWLTKLTPLRDVLASCVAEERPLTPYERAGLVRLTRALREEMAALPASLHRDVLRPPACFRGFDQRPADVATLTRGLMRRYPDRERPMLVVGVRTSGCYLAPLAAATLTAAGYESPVTLSLRPGFPLHRGERRLVKGVVERGGSVAVMDDPPVTGQAIAAAVRELRRHGVTEESATVLLATFQDAGCGWLPGYPRVTLPFADWSVHGQLAPAAVGAVLARLTGREVARIERVPHWAGLPEESRRGHVIALFRVEWGDQATRAACLVAVRGAGLGYLGRHALAAAESLGDYLPEVYGFHEGLIYRAWLPEEWRLGPADAPTAEQVAAIASYVARRGATMPARTDHSRLLAGRLPAWEVASLLLGRGFGRVGLALRPVLIDAVARRLTAVRQPSVADGATGLRQWFVGPEGRPRKADPALHHFSNADLECYDPVFDLAGAAPGAEDWGLAPALVRSYEARTGHQVDPERYLLYELVQLWDRARQGRTSDRVARRASARAAQRYFAARYLTGVTQPAAGHLVALDVDGVLESDAFGFPATTPAGALVLRALARHGYRAVLVTGRSLDEVRERCLSYGLAGGVAEYGAVLYDRRRDRVAELLTPADRDQLDRVRRALAGVPGVEVDGEYTRAVRACGLDSRGRRRHLDERVVDAALAAADPGGPRVLAVPGDAQTDFVTGDVDKGTGLRFLRAMLGGVSTRGELAVSLAVGDTDADLPMLGLAELAYAPGHATFSATPGWLRVSRRQYQAGLTEAAAGLLGHRPGGCAACRPPATQGNAHLLLSVLGAPEAGRWGIPSRALRTALALVSAGWRG